MSTHECEYHHRLATHLIYFDVSTHPFYQLDFGDEGLAHDPNTTPVVNQILCDECTERVSDECVADDVWFSIKPINH